jgi:hypothetical protein
MPCTCPYRVAILGSVNAHTYVNLGNWFQESLNADCVGLHCEPQQETRRVGRGLLVEWLVCVSNWA